MAQIPTVGDTLRPTRRSPEYVVVQVETTEALAQRYPNTARFQRESNIVASLLIRRPRGAKLSLTYLYASGVYSTPLSF